MPLRSPCSICSCVSSPASKYFSINASSASAARSINDWRILSARSLRSPGISATVTLPPSKVNSFMLNRSTIRLKPGPGLTGKLISAGLVKLSFKSARTSSNFTFSLSSWLTKIARGILSSAAYSQTCSVTTSTPDPPWMTTSARSETRSEPLTSPMKSPKPGVSSRLNLTPFSLFSAVSRLAEIELPRSISSFRWSLWVEPSSTLPIRSMAFIAKSIASLRVVLPQKPCPIKLTLRIAVTG